jgi:hypothetical protein
MDAAVGTEGIEAQGVLGNRWRSRWGHRRAGPLVALGRQQHLLHPARGDAGFGGNRRAELIKRTVNWVFW